jgi:hypothetical protein
MKSLHATGGRARRCALAAGMAASLCLAAAGPAWAVGERTAHPAHAAHASEHAPNAKAEIVANWEAFFSGKTPAKKKIALVQDGAEFAKVIEAQAKSNPLAATTTVKVSKVAVSGAKATVVYTIDLGGKPALSNQKGLAVREGKTWKVGASSFCTLLRLEGSAKGIPACATPAKKK